VHDRYDAQPSEGPRTAQTVGGMTGTQMEVPMPEILPTPNDDGEPFTRTFLPMTGGPVEVDWRSYLVTVLAATDSRFEFPEVVPMWWIEERIASIGERGQMAINELILVGAWRPISAGPNHLGVGAYLIDAGIVEATQRAMGEPS
jgi:hypothetical protein